MSDYFTDLAPSYDDDFSHRLAATWLRESVHKVVRNLVGSGDRVLEIGSGTGLDAEFFADLGCVVTATDPTPAMLEQTRSRLAGREDVSCLSWDPNRATPATIETLPEQSLVFSNFGAFNCLRPGAELAAKLALRLGPQGYLAVVVMSEACPWEIVWYGARGQPRTALRRSRRIAEIDENLTVYYHSPGRLQQMLRHHFDALAFVGIGVLLPPSFGFDLVERHPELFARLLGIERRIASYWPANRLNDHYLAIFRKRD